MARAKKTNINGEHRRAFDALRNPEYSSFALFSCWVNGEPTAAIVTIDRNGEEYTITPLFVAVTPHMNLTDHDGTPAGKE